MESHSTFLHCHTLSFVSTPCTVVNRAQPHSCPSCTLKYNHTTQLYYLATIHSSISLSYYIFYVFPSKTKESSRIEQKFKHNMYGWTTLQWHQRNASFAGPTSSSCKIILMLLTHFTYNFNAFYTLPSQPSLIVLVVYHLPSYNECRLLPYQRPLLFCCHAVFLLYRTLHLKVSRAILCIWIRIFLILADIDW